jgi:CBS domain-containing protein
VTRNDLRQAMMEGRGDCTLLEAGNRQVIVVTPNTSVRDAMLKMFQYDIGRLPVVHPENPNQILGYLSRTHVLSPYLQQLKDEQEIEMGWFAKRRGKLTIEGIYFP